MLDRLSKKIVNEVNIWYPDVPFNGECSIIYTKKNKDKSINLLNLLKDKFENTFRVGLNNLKDMDIIYSVSKDVWDRVFIFTFQKIYGMFDEGKK